MLRVATNKGDPMQLFDLYDRPRCHDIYGIPIHAPGTENYVEDDLIDGIDLIRWLERDGRRFTANYDRATDPFATTLDIEPMDDDLPPAA